MGICDKIVRGLENRRYFYGWKRSFEDSKGSKYTTVLSGFEMLQENGYPAIRDGEESYDIEQKYGYSVDEMFTSAFYSTRKPQFFEFYRN